MFYGYDLAFLRTALKPQRSYNWEIMLPSIGIIPGIVVSMLCQDIKFGDYNIADVDRLRYGAFESKFPGLMEIQDVQFTFIKPIPDLVSAYFYAWRKMIIDDAGYYGVKSEYSKKVSIYLYDTTGMISNNISLVGVFPKTLPVYDLSYSTEEIVKLSITCNVDRMSFGEYVPPTFPADIDVPITRVEDAATIGSGEVIQRQATNARVFGAQTVYNPAFSASKSPSVISQIAGAALGALASTAVKFATGAIKNIFTPTPKPDEKKQPVAIYAPNTEKDKSSITFKEPAGELDFLKNSAPNASQNAVGGAPRDEYKESRTIGNSVLRQTSVANQGTKEQIQAKFYRDAKSPVIKDSSRIASIGANWNVTYKELAPEKIDAFNTWVANQGTVAVGGVLPAGM